MLPGAVTALAMINGRLSGLKALFLAIVVESCF